MPENHPERQKSLRHLEYLNKGLKFLVKTDDLGTVFSMRSPDPNLNVQVCQGRLQKLLEMASGRSSRSHCTPLVFFAFIHDLYRYSGLTDIMIVLSL